VTVREYFATLETEPESAFGTETLPSDVPEELRTSDHDMRMKADREAARSIAWASFCALAAEPCKCFTYNRTASCLASSTSSN
jgi:hypothetical protein